MKSTAPAVTSVSEDSHIQSDDRRSYASLVRGATVVAAGLLLTRMMGEFGNSVLVSACITVIAVAGLHVLVHWAGQISLAHVAFVAIGAFATARANADFAVPLPLSILVGMLAAVAASALLGLPALRLRGFALAIATLAFGFAGNQWLFQQSWLVPVSTGVPLEADSLFGFAIRESRALVVPVLIITALVVALTVRLGSSPLGLAMRMMSHDEEVAASFGVSVAAHKLFAFLAAGACAGLAGALTVISIGRVGQGAFPPTLSIVYISVVLMGGRGPVWGSLVAGASLGAVEILLSGLGHWVTLIGSVGILQVVWISADGINGMLRMNAHAASQFIRHVRGRRNTEEEI